MKITDYLISLFCICICNMYVWCYNVLFANTIPISIFMNKHRDYFYAFVTSKSESNEILTISKIHHSLGKMVRTIRSQTRINTHTQQGLTAGFRSPFDAEAKYRMSGRGQRVPAGYQRGRKRGNAPVDGETSPALLPFLVLCLIITVCFTCHRETFIVIE